MLISEPITVARKIALVLFLARPGGHPALELEGEGGVLPGPQGLSVRESVISREGSECQAGGDSHCSL